VNRALHRLRRDLGPERTVVVDDLEGVRAELHEADRMLRRTRGGGFSAVPGGRSLVEGLVRASTGDGDSVDGTRPVAVRLEHGDRVVARAIALAGPERALVLAVACSRELPHRRYAPGRLVFARLADALTARGIHTIEGGPAAVWFAARSPQAVSLPLQTVLLVPRTGRRTAVERMAGALGRFPSLGPAERFVARLRPWTDALLESGAAQHDAEAAEEADPIEAETAAAAMEDARPTDASLPEDEPDRRDVLGRADSAPPAARTRDAA